jgi:hypothetical protein
VLKLLEGRDRIGTAKESICKELIYLSHREYKGEHTHLAAAIALFVGIAITLAAMGRGCSHPPPPPLHIPHFVVPPDTLLPLAVVVPPVAVALLTLAVVVPPVALLPLLAVVVPPLAIVLPPVAVVVPPVALLRPLASSHG